MENTEKNKEIENLISTDLKELHGILRDMKTYQERQTSLNWNFWRGIVYGLGFFVGSAILAAGILYLVSHLGISENSFIGRMINRIAEDAANLRR